MIDEHIKGYDMNEKENLTSDNNKNSDKEYIYIQESFFTMDLADDAMNMNDGLFGSYTP